MKKILYLLLFCLILFSSCKTTPAYHENISAVPAAAQFAQEYGSRLSLLSPDAISFTLNINEEDYTDAAVYASVNGASVDEFGVFMAAPQKADALEKALISYVREIQDGKTDWVKTYNPQEADKLRDARVVRMGSCLFYGFLSKERMQTLETKIKGLLYF